MAPLSDPALKGSVDHLAEVVQERTHRVSQMMRTVLGLLLLNVLVLILLFILGLTNRAILDTVRDVTEPGGEVYERNRRGTAALIQNLIVENDCRARRTHAGLSPPDQRASCAEQTPPEVFPGPTSAPGPD